MVCLLTLRFHGSFGFRERREDIRRHWYTTFFAPGMNSGEDTGNEYIAELLREVSRRGLPSIGILALEKLRLRSSSWRPGDLEASRIWACHLRSSLLLLSGIKRQPSLSRSWKGLAILVV